LILRAKSKSLAFWSRENAAGRQNGNPLAFRESTNHREAQRG
jgi:hypothetical protein